MTLKLRVMLVKKREKRLREEIKGKRHCGLDTFGSYWLTITHDNKLHIYLKQ